MPAFRVQRSIMIDAPAETVFDTVSDFGTWTTWSPWLGVDKEAVVEVSDDSRSVGSTYHWTGELVGEGEMKHAQLERPNRIEDELRFIKPFRSESAVSFDVVPKGDSTEITWCMRGNLPWFMFWMKSKMETFVGMDYERGLRMLRELIQTGAVLSNTEVMGPGEVRAIDVYGVHDSCPMNEIGPAMEKAIETCNQIFADNEIATDGDMISVYHPIDLKEGRFDFTTGYSVTPVGAPPKGIKHCRLKAGNALHVRHTGSYENLGNAWSGAHQVARYRKLKLAHQDGYEIYRNDPSETPAAEWVTDIYVPLKS